MSYILASPQASNHTDLTNFNRSSSNGAIWFAGTNELFGRWDAVNLASRVEAANKLYGTSIIACDAAVALTGWALVWRALDAVRVIGRSEAVKIYEPLAGAGQETAEQSARAAADANGLARWRTRNLWRRQPGSLVLPMPRHSLHLRIVRKY